MASPSSNGRICASSNGCNQRAITCCEGCSQRFCPTHFTEHRNTLNDEMNGLMNEHDTIKNSLAEQRKNGDAYQLIKRIYEWEKESIAKIKQRANELRSKLSQFAETHTGDFSKKFQNLSEQITTCREYGDFIETDLHRWKQTIEDIKLNFLSPMTVTIEQYDGTVLVQNISVNVLKKTTNELFEQIFDNKVRIEEDGQVVVHDTSNDCIEIRGKNEYATGCHNIRLCIEEASGGWLFLGINSKSTPLKSQSCYSTSSYGWSPNNYDWSNGQPEPNISNNRIEMKNNDIISLIFDCDNCMIRMINERTKAKYELPVIIDNCPFPWQLHVALREPNNRVRVLSD
jgi:hypothetical protein